MKTITIGFSTSINHIFPIYSWLIKLIYNTRYSHTYMKFHSDSLNRDIIYESVGVGVRFVGFKYWQKHSKVIREFDLQISDEQYRNLMVHCVDQAGIKYGRLQVVGILISKILGLRVNPFRNGDSEKVCSEEMGKVVSMTTGYIFEKGWDLLTPPDIYKALNSR
jgi:hypothetical protein